ncbi:unnamed protein product [Colias eurytheme]|nr:unnamed protein product [Colias eurytheme]
MRRGRNRMSIAPDIMEYDDMPTNHNDSDTECVLGLGAERRKRASSPHPASATPRSPHYSPRRRYSNNGRVLKVLVAKMRLDEDDEVPAKRQMISTPQSFSPRASTSQNTSHFKQSFTKRQDSENSETQSPVLGNFSKRQESRDSDTQSPILRNFSKRRDSGGSGNQSPLVRARRSVSRDRVKLSRELDGSGDSPDVRLRRLERFPSFDAPSPNGSTDARVIVSESSDPCTHVARRVKRNNSNDSHGNGNSNSDPVSDSSSDLLLEARTRRARKPIIYKEKPLNRKMRR